VSAAVQDASVAKAAALRPITAAIEEAFVPPVSGCLMSRKRKQASCPSSHSHESGG
jgi:hypothetical protein